MRHDYFQMLTALTGDANIIYRAIAAPAQRILMRRNVELTHMVQLYDSIGLPTAQQRLWQRVVSVRDYFRTPRQARDCIKLQDIVAIKLHKYLVKTDQLIDWADPKQVTHQQLVCEYYL